MPAPWKRSRGGGGGGRGDSSIEVSSYISPTSLTGFFKGGVLTLHPGRDAMPALTSKQGGIFFPQIQRECLNTPNTRFSPPSVRLYLCLHMNLSRKSHHVRQYCPPPPRKIVRCIPRYSHIHQVTATYIVLLGPYGMDFEMKVWPQLCTCSQSSICAVFICIIEIWSCLS